MLDEFRNISILNHFLQNVTCSMWDEYSFLKDNVSPPDRQSLLQHLLPAGADLAFMLVLSGRMTC